MANRFQLWGQAGWASAEVVGETHYAKAIRALFGRDFDPKGTEITVPVQLIPDRSNRHDRNAVAVWSGDGLLGHLPRSEAARYVGVLASLSSRGLVPEVSARVQGREWAGHDGRAATFDGSIRLDLGEPHMLVPANAPPAQEHRVLPAGSAVQVNGQQQFLEALRPLLRPEGECWAYVTLHEMADHLVEVRIGDARVGDLSPKMSGELLPALRHLAERGLATAARAVVKGNDGKAEVMLSIARAQDLPEAWQGGASRPSAASVSPAAPGLPVVPAGPGLPVVPAGPGVSSAMSGASSGAPGAPVVFPSGPASAQAGAGGHGVSPASAGGHGVSPAGAAGPAATGRASASVPTSGVASTGPVTTGPASAGSLPDPAGSPLPAGWTPPGELTAPGLTAPGLTAPGDAASNRSAPGGPAAPSWMPAGEPVPSWAVPPAGETVPSWAAPPETLPTWAAAPAEPTGMPSWAVPSGGVPSWATTSSAGLPTLPSTGALPGGSAPRLDPPDPSSTEPVPAASAPSSLLSTRGAAARAPLAPAPPRPAPAPDPVRAPAEQSHPTSDAMPPAPDFLQAPDSGRPESRHEAPDPVRPEFRHEAPGSARPEFRHEAPGSGRPEFLHEAPVSVRPVSAAPAERSVSLLDGPGSAIAETTVIPALTAVVKSNAARLSAVSPVSPAPEPNPHPAIPPAPTGIRFMVPPGWPVPPDGWFPPEGWRPDPSWPLAPANWQWWVPTWD